MTHEEKSSKFRLLEEVSADSSFLHLTANDVHEVINGRKIFSFYENEPTPVPEKQVWSKSLP